jgi:hypothetical protein
MTASSAKPSACLGFLSVIENNDLGLLGGYLLLNAAGRPLEFHCTAPVRATRTQEILYGKALKPYLYGEQIAATLLTKARHSPIAVFTDGEAVLAAREQAAIPLVFLPAAAVEGEQTSQTLRRGVTAPGFESDRQQITDAWPSQADHLELHEPFARIREALDEAHRAAAKAA